MQSGPPGPSEDLLSPIKILVVLPLRIIRIDEKTARYDPFFGENQFSPADEAVFMFSWWYEGAVSMYTACAEARRLKN